MRLEAHLAPLRREGLIAPWHDRQILPGSEWDAVINQHLAEADIVLLVVSANFVASDYCYEKELALALDRHERGDACVIPIIVAPVDFGTTPFAKLQVLPKDAKPVSTWSNQDEAWLDVVRRVRRLVLPTESSTFLSTAQVSENRSGGVDVRVDRKISGSRWLFSGDNIYKYAVLPLIVLLLVALAYSGSFQREKPAQPSGEGPRQASVQIMPIDPEAGAGEHGFLAEQRRAEKSKESPGDELPLGVEGEEESVQLAHHQKAVGSGLGKTSPMEKQPSQDTRRKPRPPPALIFYGTIKDDSTGNAHAGADVQLVGTSCVTRTDKYGNFAFKSCDPDRAKLLKNPMIRVRMPEATGWCNDIPILQPPAITSINIQASCQGAKFGGRGSIRIQGTQLHGSEVTSVQLGDIDLIGSTLRGLSVDTRFHGTLRDGTAVELAIIGSELDAADPAGETVLYSALMRRSGRDEWENPCLSDAMQDRRAIAVAGIWDTTGAHIDKLGYFTFACVSGVVAKCVRWGYRPWQQRNGISLKNHHQACTRMARADYCGNGGSHTREGTAIEFFDNLGGRTIAVTPGMQFEAAWTEDGATCMRRPRWREPVTAVFAGSRPSAISCEERLQKLKRASGDTEDAPCGLTPLGRVGPPALIWNYSYINSSAP